MNDISIKNTEDGMDHMNEGLVYTNDSCIGCNRCVRICRSFGASISNARPDHNSIDINPERCINCGACINVCKRNAREYHDDTERFFEDLKKGESISLLVAPAFEAKYPDEYKKILGALKKLGVKRMLPVSLGADICTWAYIKLMKEKGYTGRISTPCPVVVSYVEHWAPELIPNLMPVKSPMMCAAMYARKELGVTDKLAFIGPCIAKRMEIKKYPELLDYNITFPKVIEYARAHDMGDEEGFEGLDAGLGSFYPAPGGLADNIKWFLGDETPIRVVSGKTYLYQKVSKNKKKIFDSSLPYVLFDALNCREGCIEGTARLSDEDKDDEGLYEINDIRSRSKKKSPNSPWAEEVSCEKRLNNLYEQFKELDLSDYMTFFTDKSGICRVSYPTDEEKEDIFKSMHKEDEASRNINCSACGYDTCYEMMLAIHNGFNTRHNCVYSEKEETIFLSRMSYSDRLTGVMNRNAYENKLNTLFGTGCSLGLILADVNGLKEVNDNEGHAAGDRLIIETAKALGQEFGVERVFRIGGDEFMVVIQDFARKEIENDILLVNDYLLKENVSASIGFAYTEHYIGDLESLQELADKRMYEEKDKYYKMTGKKRRVRGTLDGLSKL